MSDEEFRIKFLTDSIDKSHKLLVELLQQIGASDGTIGWIEHADEDGFTRRDGLSLDGELIFGFDAVYSILADKDLQIENLQREVKHWQAAHSDQVNRCALLRQREDLPVDRIPAYNELVRLQERVKQLEACFGENTL